jgi:hypothetical protein
MQHDQLRRQYYGGCIAGRGRLEGESMNREERQLARRLALATFAANPADPVQWWRLWMALFGRTGTIIIGLFLLSGLWAAVNR